MKNSINYMNIRIRLILMVFVILPLAIQAQYQYFTNPDGTYRIVKHSMSLEYSPLVPHAQWFKGFYRTVALYTTSDRNEVDLQEKSYIETIKVDIFYPQPYAWAEYTYDDYKLPVIVFGYGGGFLNKWSDGGTVPTGKDHLVPEYFAKRGYIVICPKYRIGIDLYNAELAERAIWRAVQDLRVVNRFAREYKSDLVVHADPDLPLTYLGWSSGGFMGLHNLYLRDTDDIRPISTTADGVSVTVDKSHWYEKDNPKTEKTYDLGTLDVPRTGKGDNDFTTAYPDLTGSPIQDITVVVSGALGNLDWISKIPNAATTGKPKSLMLMQHPDDGVVPSGTGKAYEGFAFFNVPEFDYPTVHGTFAIDEYFAQNPEYTPDNYEFVAVREDCTPEVDEDGNEVEENCVVGNAEGIQGPLKKEVWFHNPMESGDNLAVMEKIENFISEMINLLNVRDNLNRMTSNDNKANNTTNLNNNKKSLTVYPNPATDEVSIEVTGKGAYNLQVYDATGKLLLTQKINASEADIVKTKTNDLANGLYTFKLYTENGIETTKVVIE